MLHLPTEIQQDIFSRLQLNDLTKCRRVNQSFKESATEVLRTVKHVEQQVFHYQTFFTSIIKRSFPPRNRFTADLNRENINTFIRFISNHCPSLVSINATSHHVDLEYFGSLADRLIFFDFHEIKTRPPKYLDAQLFVLTFPKLQAYRLPSWTPLCPHQIMRLYDFLYPGQFQSYVGSCSLEKRHSCTMSTAELQLVMPSMKFVRCIYNHSPRISELKPSSLASIQLFSAIEVHPTEFDRFSLPNLLYFDIARIASDLHPIIRFLSRSPRLICAQVSGRADEKAVLAVQQLLENCRFIESLDFKNSFTSTLHSAEDRSIDYHQLDLSQSQRLSSFIWVGVKTHTKFTLPSHSSRFEFCGNRLKLIHSDTQRDFSLNFTESIVSFSKMVESIGEVLTPRIRTGNVETILDSFPRIFRLDILIYEHNLSIACSWVDRALECTEVTQFSLTVMMKVEQVDIFPDHFFTCLMKYASRCFHVEMRDPDDNQMVWYVRWVERATRIARMRLQSRVTILDKTTTSTSILVCSDQRSIEQEGTVYPLIN